MFMYFMLCASFEGLWPAVWDFGGPVPVGGWVDSDTCVQQHVRSLPAKYAIYWHARANNFGLYKVLQLNGAHL